MAAVLADTIAERKKVVVDTNTQGVAGNLLAAGAKSNTDTRSRNVALFKSSCTGQISTALVQHTTASSISKAGEWLFQELCRAMEIQCMLGACFLDIDGASACKKPIRLMHANFPHILDNCAACTHGVFSLEKLLVCPCFDR